MQVSYLWLKDFVEFDLTPEDIADTLTGLGLECAIGDDRRGWYENIVIGKVENVSPHVDADKLSVTSVNVGDATLSIVCGASNVAVGMTVPVAVVGAILPDGMAIKKSKIRGEVSEGMICSEAELKFVDVSDGIMVLDDDPSPGALFAEVYEVCDVVLEVDLTPNRGDCASMVGVARDLAAALEKELKKPAADFTEHTVTTSSLISVDIQAPDRCPRYAARVIQNVNLGKSPFWLRRRLFAVGVRPVNNVVDIANYILMETGHPLHAFDYHEIKDAQIVIRRAKPEERFTTLDGKEHTLTDDNLVIADGSKAVALAGVMGGINSEVTGKTKDILLESAFFVPAAIRRTSKALGLSSESSYRFERGTDVEGLIFAQDRASSLLASVCGGQVSAGRVDVYPAKIEKKKVKLRFERLNAIIGREIGAGETVALLERLEMNVVEKTDEDVTIESPLFRFDIEREIDLIEEVARHIGYDTITSEIPRLAVVDHEVSPLYKMRRRLRRHLRSIGLSEGLGYSFLCQADIDALLAPATSEYRNSVKIDNPLTSEWTDLRTTLLPNLIRSIKGEEDASIFEIGVVFANAGANRPPVERWMASGALSENLKPGLYKGRSSTRDFFDLKGVIESIFTFLGYDGRYSVESSNEPFFYPKRQAAVTIEESRMGVFGQVHPETIERFEVGQDVFAFEIDLTRLSAVAPPEKQYTPLSRFPSVKRDLAVVAPDDEPIAKITESITRHGGQLLAGVTMFDLFRSEKVGEGKKSVAYSLEFAVDGRTMTDEEADKVFDAIVRGLVTDCNATLR